MSAIVPPRFEYALGLDVARIARASPITFEEGTDLCELPNFLYARHNRAALLDWSVIAPAKTTSAVAIPLPFDGCYARVHTGRVDFLIAAYGKDADLVVWLRDAADTTTLATASLSLNVAAPLPTAAISLGTIAATSEVLIKATFKRNTTRAEVYRVRILEDVIAASALPT